MTAIALAPAIAERLWRGALSDGGTSVPQPTTGYAVGGRVPSLELERWRDSDAAREAVETFVREHDNESGTVLGSWVDPATDTLYLDVCDVLADKRAALALARERGELAIWDYATRAECYT